MPWSLKFQAIAGVAGLILQQLPALSTTSKVRIDYSGLRYNIIMIFIQPNPDPC